jgi:hypothetical protein
LRSLAKSFGGVYLPLDDDTAVLRPALRRERTEMTHQGEENEHTRHDGTAWRHQSAGSIAGTVKAARPDGRSKRCR